MDTTEDKTINTYKANGKLLLSGEYLVLHGALALAIPLNKGQSMQIKARSQEGFSWIATHPGGEWFQATFDQSLNITNTTNREMSERLQSILKAALNQKGEIPTYLSCKEIRTHLEFDPLWGWGSSSTLISNLARWLQINPYRLLSDTFGGSGYDIAAAVASGPVFYRTQPHQTQP